MNRRPSNGRDVLVNVFLRGGMDGLTAVPPYADPDYPALRPTLAFSPPSGPPGPQGNALDLDGFFGLAPAGAPLLPAYQAGELLVLHATGSTDPSRSHFASMRRMETGTPGQSVLAASGWLARHLEVTPSLGSPLRGVSLDHFLPIALEGAPQTVPVPDPASFALGGRPRTAPEREARLAAMHARAVTPLAEAATTAVDSLGLMAGIDFDGYVPQGGAVYGPDEFGQALRHAAALIRADVGVEVIEVDLGGWDHHEQQGPGAGTFAGLFGVFAAGLAAFRQDLADLGSPYTLTAFTEFGRRAYENGSAGTDHGFGGVGFLLGGAVQGGRVFSAWPGLDPASLESGGDLDITIDYRDVLAEVLDRRLDCPDLAAVFPNHLPVFHGVVS